MSERVRKPALTVRVLRGILSIEARCGGPYGRSEAGSAGFTTKQWDEAAGAIEWAHDMLAWREAKGERRLGSDGR